MVCIGTNLPFSFDFLPKIFHWCHVSKDLFNIACDNHEICFHIKTYSICLCMWGCGGDLHRHLVLWCQRAKFWDLCYCASIVCCINQLYQLQLVHIISSKDLSKESSLSLSSFVAALHVRCVSFCCHGACSKFISSLATQLQKHTKWLKLVKEMKLYVIHISLNGLKDTGGAEGARGPRRWEGLGGNQQLKIQKQLEKSVNWWPEHIRWP
jgi:hypothetical protein